MLGRMIVVMAALLLAAPVLAQDAAEGAEAAKEAGAKGKGAAKKAGAKGQGAMKKAGAKGQAAAKKAGAAKGAAAKKAGAAKGAAAKKANPLDAFGGWKPQPVRKKDIAGVRGFLKKLDKAWAGGPDAVAAHMIFPVLMVTTTSDKKALASAQDVDAWKKSMNMPPEAAEAMKKVKSAAPQMSWVTEEIVWVNQAHSLLSGKKLHKWNSGMLLMKQDGAWKVKAMGEGGWGDPPGAARPAAEPVGDDEDADEDESEEAPAPAKAPAPATRKAPPKKPASGAPGIH